MVRSDIQQKIVMAIHGRLLKIGEEIGDGKVCTGISIFRQRERFRQRHIKKRVSRGGVNVSVHTTLAADTWSKPL
jgi:hypothetical protein